MRSPNTSSLVPFTLSFALLAACGEGGETKAKIDIVEDGTGAGTANADTIPGNWRFVQSVESAHPYAHNTTQPFTVSGNASAERMKVVFTRFELESGYDYLTTTDATGGQSTRHTGTKTGQETVVMGGVVKLNFTSDYSVATWGFKVDIYQEEPCACIALYNPVCGQDGTTYSNGCAAACANQPVAYDGECQTTWTKKNVGIESAHPYANNTNKTFTVSEPGAARIRLHFSRIALENGYDYLRLKNSAGQLVTTYTGDKAAFTSVAVDGESLTLELTSDFSVTKWGFAVDYYEFESVLGCRNDADCGANETCVQVQCIRAPCPALCQPRDNGPVDVTLAELQSNPAAYNDRTIRVVGEPLAPTPVCTRIACPPENPCCNQCNSGFVLGDTATTTAVYLNHDDGSGISCSGNSCDWVSNCEGFDPYRNGEYSFVGRFSVDTNGTRTLAVSSFTATTCTFTGCGNACKNYLMAVRCAFVPEWQCYEAAGCEVQGDGHCGFNVSETLNQCIVSSRHLEVSATGLPVSIPDNNATGATVNVQVAAPGRLVDLLTVTANITHTYRGDLTVTLLAPDNTPVVLHNRTGGSADNLALTVDVPSLAGRGMEGTWKLKVVDSAAADTGTVTSFTLTFR